LNLAATTFLRYNRRIQRNLGSSETFAAAYKKMATTISRLLRRLLLVVSLVAGLLFQSLVIGDEIYFTTGSGLYAKEVWRVNLDGTDLKQIVPERPSDYGIAAIAFNQDEEKVYWAQHYDGILRSSFDGDNIEVVIGPAGIDQIPLVAYDIDAHAIIFDKEFMYWGSGFEEHRISRLNLADPTDAEPIIRSLGPWLYGMAFDASTESLYWTEEASCFGCTGLLKRAAVDGSNISVIARPSAPGKVALDDNGFVYRVDGGLYRSRLDGSDAVQIIDNVSTFALDSRANSILFVRGNNL
jgi:hypothetical protein